MQIYISSDGVEFQERQFYIFWKSSSWMVAPLPWILPDRSIRYARPCILASRYLPRGSPNEQRSQVSVQDDRGICTSPCDLLLDRDPDLQHYRLKGEQDVEDLIRVS